MSRRPDEGPKMTAVYNYDYADRLTVALHNTARFSSSTLFLALLFHVLR